jgi:hypothetical protein
MKYNKFALVGFVFLITYTIYILGFFIGFSEVLWDKLGHLINNNIIYGNLQDNSFTVWPLLALIFGGIGWRQIKKSGEKGMAFAKLSVIVPVLLFLLVIFAEVFLMEHEPSKSPTVAIKADLANSRQQASIYYNKNNLSYEGVCTKDGGINLWTNDAVKWLNKKGVVDSDSVSFLYDKNGKAVGSAVCHDSRESWAAIVSLPKNYIPNAGWCVDSIGASKEATKLEAGAMVCP